MFFIPLSNYLTTAGIIVKEVIAKYYSREIERDWNYAARNVTLKFIGAKMPLILISPRRVVGEIVSPATI